MLQKKVESAAKPYTSNSFTMRISLINEEPIMIKMVSGFLTDLGHEVTSFSSIPQFLSDKSDSTRPAEVILIDLSMSEGKNIQVIRDIHRRFPESRIIVMSTVLPAEEAISHGVYAYFDMPINLSKLELIILRIKELCGDSIFKSGNGGEDGKEV